LLLCIFAIAVADHWGYPYNETEWGLESATCAEGKMQSPVDLVTHSGIAQTELNILYDMPPNLTASSEYALTWSVTADFLPTLFFEEFSYALVKVACHIGSEHTVDGFRYAGSCNFVHQIGNEYAVIAVLLSDTAMTTNAAFDDLLNNIQLDWDTMISGLDLRYYWEYTGSFTTPDCEEDVQWIVLRDVLEVTPDQIEQMKTISGLNNSFRDPMPLNGRAVRDGSEIGNVTVLWYVVVGYCTNSTALKLITSVAEVLGLSEEEMVLIHLFELHGDRGWEEEGESDVFDIEYKLSVVDNTKSFVDRFLENVGVNYFDNGNVTKAILKHFEAETGIVVQHFASWKSNVIYSTWASDGDDDTVIIIIVVVVVLVLCLIVAIYFFAKKRKVEKEVAVEITVDEENAGTIQTRM